MFEALGVAGIAISMLAYLPQVVHLAKEHCSAGVSSRAWAMWLVSSLLIGALAVHRHDAVFILLQISSLASAAAMLFLAEWSWSEMRWSCLPICWTYSMSLSMLLMLDAARRTSNCSGSDTPCAASQP